ncbi:MAG: ADP-ribosylglycohydrolase family protein [Bacilli bacterium]
MWGAIIGDLAGSIYEYEQTKKIMQIQITNNIIPENAFYSDDTILTIAVLDAILTNVSYEVMLRKYGVEFLSYKPKFVPYFKNSFSPGFIRWLNNKDIGVSNGNGAMMRISSIGYLFDSEEEVIRNVRLATMPSHNSIEALECTTIIAKVIYLARQGYNKKEIIQRLDVFPKYVPFQKFNMSCFETIYNCLEAVFSSESFNESIVKIISYGGDTDTNACIVGSMAEALYGIDQDIIKKAKEKIPALFVKKLELGYNKIRK